MVRTRFATLYPSLFMNESVASAHCGWNVCSCPTRMASSVANVALSAYAIWLAVLRRIFVLRTLTPASATGRGIKPIGPRPSMNPCASTSTSRSTHSGCAVAKSIAAAPPRDAATSVMGRPISCFQKAYRCARFASGE